MTSAVRSARRGRLLLATGAAVAVAAAVPALRDTAPAPAAVPDAALSDAQRQLTERALATLVTRGCTSAPHAADLDGLPGKGLECLGTGPRRPPSAGDGRPTVLNVWASWCNPCVEELPLLQAAADAAGPGVRFVGIDTEDDRASAAALLDATGVRFENYEDPDSAVRAAVGAVGLPVTLVFDRSGREVARRMGTVDRAWLDDALRQAG